MFESKINKRGVSTVIATIILIVLVLVAVGIVWAVINNIISKQTEGISLGKLTLDADIKGVGINETTNTISVLVKRKPGQGNLAGFKFVFKNETDTEVWEENATMNELEERLFTFTLTMNVSEVITITLVPLIKSGDKKVLGNVVDVYDVKTGRSIEPPSGVVCGDGLCEVSENCPQDNVSCMDNICYEPTCTNGCGESLVSVRGNDGDCLLPSMCDGAGNCVECVDISDCGVGDCVGGSCVVTGNVYYVDFIGGSDSNDGLSTSSPWKYAPGMVGFSASYTHQSGDRFVFKGGVTWPSSSLPLTISHSGNSTHYDEYTVDYSWYSGGSWSRPIFDGENIDLSLITFGGDFSNIKIKGIRLRNSAIESGGVRGVIEAWLKNADNIIIEDSYIEENLLGHGILLRGRNRQLNGWVIKNNTIYGGCERAINLGWSYNGLGYLNGVDGVVIEDNKIYGRTFTTQCFAQGNFDALYMSGSSNSIIRNNEISTEANNEASHTDNIQLYVDGGGHEIYNNYLSKKETGNYGNKHIFMMSEVIQEVIPTETKIHHNVIYQPTGLYATVWVNIRNITFDHNTIYRGADNAWIIIVDAGSAESNGGRNLKTRNNIFYHTGINGKIYVFEIADGFESNYNQYYTNNQWGTITQWTDNSAKDFSQWQAMGFDLQGQEGDPQWINPPNDFTLQSTSPCRDKAVNLGYAEDFLGNSMYGSAWDIGAYEYVP